MLGSAKAGLIYYTEGREFRWAPQAHERFRQRPAGRAATAVDPCFLTAPRTAAL